MYVVRMYMHAYNRHVCMFVCMYVCMYVLREFMKTYATLLSLKVANMYYIQRLTSDSPGLVSGQLAHCEVLHGGQLLWNAENQARPTGWSLWSQSVALGQP